MPGFSRTVRRTETGSDHRRELGEYLRALREERGLTQAEMAHAVGVEWPTMISAIESGGRSLPPERYLAYAEALGVDVNEFAKTVLQFTNPWVFAMLYSDDPRPVFEELNVTAPPRSAKRAKGPKPT